jgi:carboxylate-amine ligase
MIEFKRSEPLSIGVELELQLLQAETLDLTDGILPLMEFYPDSPYVKPESIQNTVEIASKVCTSIAELKVHLTALVADLKAKCQALGMRLCGAGTHPFCQRLALITPLPRYLAMEERYGHLAHTQSPSPRMCI